jgi:hypothetical protein
MSSPLLLWYERLIKQCFWLLSVEYEKIYYNLLDRFSYFNEFLE